MRTLRRAPVIVKYHSEAYDARMAASDFAPFPNETMRVGDDVEVRDLTLEQKVDVALETLARIDALLEDWAPALDQLRDKLTRRQNRGDFFRATRT